MDFEAELNSNYHELSNFIEGQFYDEIFEELKYNLNQIFSAFEFYEMDINSNSYGSNMTANLIDFAYEEGKNNFKKIVSRYTEYFNDSLKEFRSAVLYVLENEKEKDIIKRKINGLLENFLSELNSFRVKASYEEFDFLEELQNRVRRSIENEDLVYELCSELQRKGRQLSEILINDISTLIGKVLNKEQDFLEELSSNIKDYNMNKDIELHGEVSWFKRENGIITFDGQYLFEFKSSNKTLQSYLDYLQKAMTIFDATHFSDETVISNDFEEEFRKILDECIRVAIDNNCFQDLASFMNQASKIGSLGRDLNVGIQGCYELVSGINISKGSQISERLARKVFEEPTIQIKKTNQEDQTNKTELGNTEVSFATNPIGEVSTEELQTQSDTFTEPTQRLKININGNKKVYGPPEKPEKVGFYIPTDFDGEEQEQDSHRGR